MGKTGTKNALFFFFFANGGLWVGVVTCDILSDHVTELS